MDTIKWNTDKIEELEKTINLIGIPDYMSKQVGGSALWKPNGLEILICDEPGKSISVGFPLDIFMEIRDSQISMDKKEFYRRLAMIHKLSQGICYDYTNQYIWVKGSKLVDCLELGCKAKNIDSQYEPMSFDFAF